MSADLKRQDFRNAWQPMVVPTPPSDQPDLNTNGISYQRVQIAGASLQTNMLPQPQVPSSIGELFGQGMKMFDEAMGLDEQTYNRKLGFAASGPSGMGSG